MYFDISWDEVAEYAVASEVRFYQSYDSRPPAEGQNSDYGIVTSLGYTF